MEDFFSTEQESENFDFSKYLRAIRRHWWIVVSVFVIVFIPWYLFVKKQPFLYEAEAIISFENLTGEFSRYEIDNRMLKMRSRSFAEDATQKLGLTLEILNSDEADTVFMRQNIFSEFFTNRSPQDGLYTIQCYPNSYFSLYHDATFIDSLYYNGEDSLYSFVDNGFYFKLNPDIFIHHLPIEFHIHDFQSSAISLQAKENIQSSEAGDIMSLSLKDENPILAYQTVNMLAELYVQKSEEMKQENSRFIKDYLYEQLAYVRKDLDQSDFSLKSFMQNHVVDLDIQTEEIVREIQGYEAEKEAYKLNKEEILFLLDRLNPDMDNVDIQVTNSVVYNQLVTYPAFEEDQEMILLHDEYRLLSIDRDDLLEQLPENNPDVLEISEKMFMLEERIYQQALEFIAGIDKGFVQIDRSIDSLQQMLTALPEEQLRLVKLTRQRSANEEIYNMLLKRYKEAQISEAVVSDQAYILDPAIMPASPLYSDRNKKMAMGGILAIGLAFGLVIMLEFFDKRIRSHSDVKRYLKLPIIGTIPKVKFDEYELQDSEKAKSISSQIVTHDYSPTPVGEAYRSLRTNLLFNKDFGNVKSMIIGSVSPGEGKSFTATNLAITMAQQKSKTLLIDADLRRGVLHNTFNVPKKPGLTNYLTGMASLDEVLNETYVPNLNLITCGSMIPNPSELIGSQNMAKFLDGLKKRYDFIIFDTPPLFAASDAVILGSLVDGVGILVRSNVTNWEKVKRKLELFQNVRIKVFGIILNCAGVEVAHDGYSYYSY